MNLTEYQSPETIEIVTTWGQTVLVVAGVVAAMGAFMRWVGKRWDHRIEVIAERRDDALAERLTAALDQAVHATAATTPGSGGGGSGGTGSPSFIGGNAGDGMRGILIVSYPVAA